MQTDQIKPAILFTMLVFFLQPILLGTWFSQVAQIKMDMDLSKSQLSLALIGLPTGVLPALYFARIWVEKWGPRTVLKWIFPLYLIFGILPGYVNSLILLYFSLVAMGACLSVAELAMNVYAGRVEKKANKIIMNRAHGFWSAGVMTGSLIGVQLATWGQDPGFVLLFVALISLPILMYITVRSPHIPGLREHQNDTLENDVGPIPKALIFIAIVVIGTTLIEGSMNDWATIYMVEIVEITGGREGLAIAIFAGFVTLGRFIGDRLNMLIGPVLLAQLCIGSAIAGLLLLILTSGAIFAGIGFALAGFGISTIFPLGVSASAAIDEVNVERNVAIMTFGALTGFLIAPPAIGFLAEAANLQIAFLLLLPGALASLLLARYLRT